MIILALTILYIFFAYYIIAPAITHVAFGQQFNTPDQFNNPQQFGQDQFPQQGQFDQFGSNQFQGGYNQYGGTPYGMQQYGPYQQQGYGYQQNQPVSIMEIITLITGGGGVAYGRYAHSKANKLEDVTKDLAQAELETKKAQAELARVSYSKMTDGGTSIIDAPSIKLENLNDNIDEFSKKVAKV